MKKYIIGLLVMAMLSGCEKQVTDLYPTDQIPADRAFENIVDINNGVIGVYGAWSERRMVYISSFMTDEIKLGTGSEYRNIGNALFRWQHVSDSQDWRDDETGGVWRNMYQVIDRINRALFYMEKVTPATPAEETLKNQYKGELLALRAMAHLNLLRTFGNAKTYDASALGVTVMKEYVVSVGTYTSTRATYGEVIAAINADLETAKTLIPANFTNVSRITRNAVSAIQARTALFSNQWQAVIDRATEVLAAQPISTGTAYSGLWTTRSLPETQATEVIWKYNVQASNLGSNVGNLWQDNPAGRAVQATPSDKLRGAFDQVNDRRFPLFFQTGSTAAGGAARNLIAKYGYAVTTNTENFQYDIKVLRSSEFLLSRAEAYAELGRNDLANADLAQLRIARIAGYTHTDINDKTQLINAILQERYKELCYEGNRYYDLKRRGLPIERLSTDVVGDATIQTLEPTNTKFILPIPQPETFANPSLQQNPGY